MIGTLDRGIDIVVAADSDLGIARGGRIPWRLPGDLAHFKRITTTAAPGRQNAVVMGRKTWESLPERFRPLPGRINVVLSRHAAPSVPAGVIHAPSLDAALAELESGGAGAGTAMPEGVDRVGGGAGVGGIFVIGGGAVYADAVASPHARDIYLTRVVGSFECDVFFPRFEDRYCLIAVLAEQQENDIDYRIELWRNKECI